MGIVEELELRLGRDRCVDRFLPGDARFPEVGERLLRSLGPVDGVSRGTSHSTSRRGPTSPLGIVNVASAGASKRTSLLRARPSSRGTASCGRAALRSSFERRLDLRLVLVLDDVDLGIVDNRFQRDVRYALVDEAVANVAVRRPVGKSRPLTSASLRRPSGESASR